MSKTTTTLFDKYLVPSLVGGSVVYSARNKLKAGGQAKRIEDGIMREYIGGAGAKYAELEQQESVIEYIETKIAFTKEAAYQGPGTTFQEAAVKTVATESVNLLGRLISRAIGSAKKHKEDEPVRKAIIDRLKRTDSIIRDFDKNHPGMLQETMNTMSSVAPTLSINPLTAQAFLRNAVLSGGPIDPMSIKSLADAETSVLKARKENQWSL
jgi:hypothetical protein